MASTYLTSNIGSPSQQRFTWSLWVKRSKLGVEQHMVGNYNANNRTHLFFTNTEKLYFYSELSGSNVIAYQTNRLFRDLNAWYHIVCAVDTTQAGGNRIRIYVNGEEETSFATETECNQNTNLSIGTTHYIGTYGGDAGSASYSFDGSISHLHFVDGSQLTPSSFGSTDSTTGEWKINTSPSVTYGSSGYFILKDGNSVTDQSGNSNNFTVAGGTLTNTEDNPSNVFATLSPLHLSGTQNLTNLSFSNGNNTVTSTQAGSPYPFAFSTIAASSGKYYAEFKTPTSDSSTMGISTGVGSGGFLGGGSSEYAYYYDGRLYNNGSGSSTGFDAWSDNDIIGVAIDLDNNKIYFHKNGTYQNSGNPTAGTGGNSITAPSSNGTGFYHFACGDAGGGTPSVQANFGNGYFGTTAVATNSGNGYQDADGNGIMNYSVPTNYRCLCTKGLNQ
jgi:hypothetical protein